MPLYSHEWATLLKDYWPSQKRVYTEEDASRWEKELERFIPRDEHLDEIEMCETIRDISMSERSKYAPSLKEFRIAFFRRRKAARVNDEPEKESCALCKHTPGWMSYFPKLDVLDMNTHADYSSAHCQGIPCKCSAGDHVMNNFTPYDTMDDKNIDAVNRKRDIAVRQSQRLIQIGIEQATPDFKNVMLDKRVKLAYNV